jgi:hypothetical protein
MHVTNHADDRSLCLDDEPFAALVVGIVPEDGVGLGVATIVYHSVVMPYVRPSRGGPDGPVAVISYSFWQRRFGGSADVIGEPLMVERVSYTIIGVTPPEFFGAEVGRKFDVAIPIGTEPLVRGRESSLDGRICSQSAYVASFGHPGFTPHPPFPPSTLTTVSS